MTNLNEIDVLEMDMKEIKEIEGGNLAAMVGLYILCEVAANPSAHYEAFMRGWNA